MVLSNRLMLMSLLFPVILQVILLERREIHTSRTHKSCRQTAQLASMTFSKYFPEVGNAIVFIGGCFALPVLWFHWMNIVVAFAVGAISPWKEMTDAQQVRGQFGGDQGGF